MIVTIYIKKVKEIPEMYRSNTVERLYDKNDRIIIGIKEKMNI